MSKAATAMLSSAGTLRPSSLPDTSNCTLFVPRGRAVANVIVLPENAVI